MLNIRFEPHLTHIYTSVIMISHLSEPHPHHLLCYLWSLHEKIVKFDGLILVGPILP